ncbi:hypothetical protein [Embleya sp. NPDC059259]
MQPTDLEQEFIGPYLPVGEYGPYPNRLRQQFEGVSAKARLSRRSFSMES